MSKREPTDEEIAAVRDRVEALARGARVLIVRSRLTDTALFTSELDSAGIGFREYEMPMGDREMRAEFDALARSTGSRRLPQVFVDGEFVGGPLEALKRLGLAEDRRRARLRELAAALGYAGLIPFLAATVLLLAGHERVFGIDVAAALVAYGAVILSFMGAVHWGLAMARAGAPGSTPLLGLSVVPALLAWFALLGGLTASLVVQPIGFAALHAYERLVLGRGVFSQWYLKLRLILTSVVVLSLVAALYARLALA